MMPTAFALRRYASRRGHARLGVLSMKLLISDMLDAYRADLSNAARTRFSESDPTWLAFGTQLQRAISLPNAERTAYLRAGASKLANESTRGPLTSAIGTLARDLEANADSNVAVCTAVMFVAEDAEDAGAFAVATLMLDFARVLVAQDAVRLQGRLLSGQARILRKIGESDAALELYGEVADMGAIHGDQELVVRSHLGQAALARTRGNYPQSRAEYLAALDVVGATDPLQGLQVNAHHGLLIVSAIAKDFDAALRHGSLALAAARTDDQRVELLLNLAAVCYDVGWFRSSLHGYLHALARGRTERIRIPAFGGAAVAAARLHETETVHTLTNAGAALLTHGRLEYELADMTREFAEAYGHLGDVERYARYQHEALERARRGGFFEIIHRLETFQRPSPVAQLHDVVLTGDALAVATDLASGDSEELLLAAVSGG